MISLRNRPIFDQLQLEEALLRTENKSFLIVNYGSPRAIVMGISGNPEQLLDLKRVREDQIPIIKRFSGGGTVIVDEKTLFVSFIFSKQHLDISPFPEPILRWTADLYSRSWQIPEFALRENDYVIGDKKCGGNAQYIQKERFLHHTSFLWDYREENMNYLLLPPKKPFYRKDRDHSSFLTRLKEHAHEPNILIQRLEEELVKQFYIVPFDFESWNPPSHRNSLQRIEF